MCLSVSVFLFFSAEGLKQRLDHRQILCFVTRAVQSSSAPAICLTIIVIVTVCYITMFPSESSAPLQSSNGFLSKRVMKIFSYFFLFIFLSLSVILYLGGRSTYPLWKGFCVDIGR